MSDKFLRDLIEFGKRLPKVDPFWKNLPPPGAILDTHTWLRVRAGTLEGWDPNAERAAEDFDLVEKVFAEGKTIKQRAAVKVRNDKRTAAIAAAMDKARAVIAAHPGVTDPTALRREVIGELSTDEVKLIDSRRNRRALYGN